MYKSAIAKNVKFIIKDRCLSQGAMARKAGHDGKAFSNMLNGRKIITDLDVANITTALGVDANILFGINNQDAS